jgi:hypothetical protein
MIFLDVDGVLADFAGAAAKLHGRHDPIHMWWPRGTYDMVGVLGLTDAEFWAPINDAGADFWAGLDVLPHVPVVLREIERTGLGFTLLTSPSHHPSSLHGKLAWIQRVFGSEFRDYLIGPPKHLCARTPGAILIDDFPANCQRFGDAGGMAVLFPALWNEYHADWSDPHHHVRNALEHMIR